MTPRRFLPFAAASVFALPACESPTALPLDGKPVAAHWVAVDTVLVPAEMTGAQRQVALQLRGLGSRNGIQTIKLVEREWPDGMKEALPHLSAWVPMRPVDEDYSANAAKAAVRDIVSVVSIHERGATPPSQTVAQTGWLLDDLYTSGTDDADEVDDFGATLLRDGRTQFKLWAPRAQSVFVVLYDAEKLPLGRAEMSMDTNTGVWSFAGPGAPMGTFYRYEISQNNPAAGGFARLEVTDPYALSLSTDSAFSQVVDLADPETAPEGWLAHPSPDLDQPEDQIIYEVHIGDFSATDETVPAARRGRYGAFLESDSDGVAHLTRLRAAGLNTIHLLPTYDIGTVPEAADGPITLDLSVDAICGRIDVTPLCDGSIESGLTLRDVLEGYDPRTGDAQALVDAIDEIDDFNWGYDPVHYTVPEGSYAEEPDGIARIIEFRAMVQRLHSMGFRVVMDVVYNHTYRAGVDDLSVLDKIVPGYYHRLNPLTGTIEQSTCCENTATERAMMGKLMIDSLAVWAREYRIDGFRFDLMGHQPAELMLKARQVVQDIDPDTYFYGEGWDFGEVAGNARFRQATQREMAGTEIGTFTDRLRDAVRGGSSFVQGAALRRGQGLSNGQWVYPNDLAATDAAARDAYGLALAQARLGLAGNLANFRLTRMDGSTATGAEIPYGDAPAGYAIDPADTINYVSKHDNQTLWDNNQYRTPYDATPTERTRMQMLGLAFPLYAQGVPFLHMGSDLLRSKSFTRDSFNSGHWFNAVDWSAQSNNYDVGLPTASKDADSWEMIRTLLTQNEGRDRVGADEIGLAHTMMLDMLKIRSGSPLFTLPSAEEIEGRVGFLNAGPESVDGMIAMLLDDGFLNTRLTDLDPAFESIVVVFNMARTEQTLPDALATEYALHPVHLAGEDKTVKQARADAEGFTVPGFTVAVFVQAQVAGAAETP